MAGNARFHDKLHRRNHHTLSSYGFPDSASDPIASREQPFQGDFIVNGTLSSNAGFNFLSATAEGSIYCADLFVSGTTTVNFVSGQDTETIISDGALTGYGDNTLTLDFTHGVYVNTPLLNATQSISANSNLYADSAYFNNLNVAGVFGIASSVLSSNTPMTIGGGLTANTAYIQNDLSVGGNLIITGNLSALGDVTVIETNLVGTSSLSVLNTGLLPGLVINQISNQPIAQFKSNGSDVLSVSSGLVTVYSDLTSSGSINSPNINLLQNTSANWNSVYTTVNASSSNYEITYNIVNQLSSNWNTNYDSTFNTSGYWNQAYSSLTATSGNWNRSFTALTANSANWNSSFSALTATSANWNEAYVALTATSGNWNRSFTALTATSGDWNQSYNALTSTSADWNSSYLLLTSTSADWDNAFASLTATSGNWDQSYSLLSTSSADWDSTKTTVSSSSASWLTGGNSVIFSASSLSVNDTLSTNVLKIYQTTYLSVSSISLSAPSTLILDKTSPSYWFIKPLTLNEIVDVNLPLVNSNDIGMMYFIKNTYVGSGDYDIHVNDNSSNLIKTLLGNTGSYVQLTWDGTVWQTIMQG